MFGIFKILKALEEKSNSQETILLQLLNEKYVGKFAARKNICFSDSDYDYYEIVGIKINHQGTLYLSLYTSMGTIWKALDDLIISNEDPNKKKDTPKCYISDASTYISAKDLFGSFCPKPSKITRKDIFGKDLIDTLDFDLKLLASPLFKAFEAKLEASIQNANLKSKKTTPKKKKS
jgi:hypothetical protein